MNLAAWHQTVSDKIRTYRYFPKASGWISLGLIGLFCLYYAFPRYAVLRPQGNHQWRQADCLSITQNYYKENRPFLSPATHFSGRDGTGRTISEFPILYYGVSRLWRITGKSEMEYRLVVLALLILGLLAMMKTAELFLEDSVFAILITLLFFTSPIIPWYGLNFLSDIPALSFSLIGAWLLARFSKSEKHLFLFSAVGFFLIAGLLKASAALIPAAIAGLAGYLLVFKKKPEWRPMNPKSLFLVGFLVISWVAWYAFAHVENALTNENQFLVGILPIWKMTGPEIAEVIHSFWWNIFEHVFKTPVWTLSGLMIVYLLIRRAFIPGKLLVFTLFLSAGVVAFVLLFFQVFDDHDYYLINMMPIFPVIWLLCLITMKKADSRVFFSPLLLGISLLFLAYNAEMTRRRFSERYSGWMNEPHLKNTLALEDITPWLRDLGIKREDKFLVPGDPSINISLYLADQKGWTNYIDLSNPLEVDRCIAMGAEYLMILPNGLEGRDWIRIRFPDSLGSWKGVEVWKRSGKDFD